MPAAEQHIERVYAAAHATLRHFSDHRNDYLAVLKALEPLRIIAVEHSGASIDVSLAGDRRTIARAFMAMRRLGYFLRTDRPKRGETQWVGKWSHENGTGVWMMFSSTVCRRVKVRTELVEQEVFETVCDEGVAA